MTRSHRMHPRLRQTRSATHLEIRRQNAQAMGMVLHTTGQTLWQDPALSCRALMVMTCSKGTEHE